MTTPAQPGPSPEALATFRAKAREIVVMHGGITPFSLAKLSKIAQDLGLPRGSWESELSSLGRRAPTVMSPEQQRFAGYVKTNIVKEGIVTTRLRQSLLQQAAYYRIDAGQAADTVERVALENNCPIVDEANATLFVQQLIERESANGYLPWSKLGTIYSQAGKLGIPRHKVKALLRGQNAERYDVREHSRRQQRLALRLGLGGLGLLVVVVIIGVLAKAFSDPPQPQVDPSPPPSPANAHRSAPPAEWKPDAELVQKIEAAKKHFASHANVLNKLLSPREPERLDAYQRLVALHPRLLKNDEVSRAVTLALAGCLAAEPSDQAAHELTEALLKLIAPPTLEASAFDPAFWAVDVALLGLVHPNLPRARADSFTKELERAIGSSLDRSRKPEQVIAQGRQALCERFYSLISTQASGDPDRGLKLHQALQSHAGRHLPAERWERLDADFVLAAMNGLGQRKEWEQVGMDLLKRVAQSKQPGIVRRVIDYYERAGETPLKNHLEKLLGERTNVDITAPLPRAQKASQMRAALGSEADLANTPADRSARLLAFTKTVLKPAPDARTGPEAQLREAVNLAHVATLACALAQEKSTAFDRFDDLAAKGLPRLEAKKPMPEDAPADGPDSAPPPPKPGPPGAGFSEASAARVPPLHGAILKLKSDSQAERLQGLKDLAASPERKDLAPAQAEEIVRYILVAATRNQAEFNECLTAAEKLAESRHFTLAVADVFLGPNVSIPVAEKLVAVVTRQSVALNPNFDWRRRCRQIILRHVLEKMDSNNLYDAACDRLRELYRDQALVLGLGAQDLMLMPTPSPLLEALIKLFARNIKADSLAAEARQFLDRLPHELAAAQYLARNDIQHLVLLQRLWLQTLVIHVSQRRPERAIEAQDLVTELAAEDAKATHIIQQVRAGEEKLLRAWLVLAVKK